MEELERRCDLPYSVGYHKSNIGFCCYQCRMPLNLDNLVVSVRDNTAPVHQPDRRFHLNCFFHHTSTQNLEINPKQLRGFHLLKWNDKQLISEIIELLRDGKTVSFVWLEFSSVSWEHAKSSRGKCGSCGKFIPQGELKLKSWGQWFHAKCMSEHYRFTQGNVEDIRLFGQMRPEEQVSLRETFQSRKEKSQPVPEKQTVPIRVPLGRIMANLTVSPRPNPQSPGGKSEAVASPASKKSCKRVFAKFKPKTAEARLTDKLERQTELWWKLNKQFETRLSYEQMVELLKINYLTAPEDEEMALIMLTDCALFGKPARCPKCPSGQIVFSVSKNSYACLGYVSEYTKCLYQHKNPLRSPFTADGFSRPQLLDDVKFNMLRERLYDPSLASPVRAESSKAGHFPAFKSQQSAAELYDSNMRVKCNTDKGGKVVRVINAGTVVDPESGLAGSRVYTDRKGVLYSVTLGQCDMTINTNSYFKMQILVTAVNGRESYYLFESWGRVGTDRGDTRLSPSNETAAVDSFQRIFFTKTGNNWVDRRFFIKKAGRMAMIDVDYTDAKDISSDEAVPAGSRTTLHPAIQLIIRDIFNVDNMKAAMKGFEIDLDRLPLGKLSKKQIMDAYSVLKELQTILEKSHPEEELILDASNRFFTLIPHNFGMNAAEPLSTVKMIKDKCTMLDSLLEIEFVYGILKGENVMDYQGRDPIDVHYEKLKCAMEYVDPKSGEYAMVKKYISHKGPSHTWRMQLEDVIKISRSGEQDRFCTQLGNRKLLWHGSGKTNYAGILGQGLRIAPPEAPVSGYMFGKGVYFADLVTKSANYCRIKHWGESVLLLLADVALGNVQNEYNAFPGGIVRLRQGFDSVKGLGETGPHPCFDSTGPDGVTVPLGEPVKLLGGQHGVNFNLLFNEYIVYDVNQVNLRYLVRAKMNYERNPV